MIKSDGLLSNEIIGKLPLYFHTFGSDFKGTLKQILLNYGSIGDSQEVLDLLKMRFEYAGSIQETLRRVLHRQSDDRFNLHGEDPIGNRPFHLIFGKLFMSIFFDPSAKELRFPESLPLTPNDYSNEELYKTAKKNLSLKDTHHEQASAVQAGLRLYLLGNNPKRSTDEFKAVCESLYHYSLLYGDDSVLDPDIQDFIGKRYLFNEESERQIEGTVLLENPRFPNYDNGVIQHPGGFGILKQKSEGELQGGLLSTSEYDAHYLESVQSMFIKLTEELKNIQVTPRNHAYFNFIIEEIKNHTFAILGYRFELLTCYGRDKDQERFSSSDDKKPFLDFLKGGGNFSTEMGSIIENQSFTKYRLHKKVNNEPEIVTIESFIQSLLDLVISISVLVSKEGNNYDYLGKNSISPHLAMNNFLERHFPFVLREVLLDSHY